MSTVIVADSRGAGLQPQIESYGLDNVMVLSHRGAGSELAVLKSMRVIRDQRPGLVVLMTGVCDLTWRDGSTKVTTLRNATVEENVLHVTGAIKSATELLKSIGSHRVTVATITGIDLSDYNNPTRKHMNSDQYKQYCATSKIKHPLQDVLNESVLQINRQITALNQANTVPTVWLGGVVHTHTKRKTYHYYIRLFDGCHPDQQTKTDWANQMVKALKRIH